MATQYTPHYNLKQPDPDDFIDINDLNPNFAAIDAALKAHDDQLTPAEAKAEPVDADSLVIADATTEKKKKLTFAALKAWIGGAFAALSHGHAISEVTDLGAQLSNKAGIKGLIQASTDLNNLFDMGFYHATDVTAASIQNTPLSHAFHLYIFRADADAAVVRTLQILTASSISHGAQPLWYRKHNGLGWSKWYQLATAEPPTEYDLPLAAGFAPYESANGVKWPCTYNKDQFGRVNLVIRLITQLALGSGTIIATLPAGFRPQKTVTTACRIAYHGESTPIIAQVDIQLDGIIRIYTQPHAATSGNSSIIVPPCNFSYCTLEG